MMTIQDSPTSFDPCAATASELARRIADGSISSAEAVEAHIARIERVNPALNAVVVKRYDDARAEARDADRRRAAGEPLGALHGVPVTVKECLDFASLPSTFGLASRARHAADADDPYVARLRAAGAIVLGKTNVAQLLLAVESSNPVYGKTNNPWNLDRSPGGSSGGEGAIVASGGSPLGIGTDIGGSVRIPAAFCGITALKPTQGRTPDLGRYSVPIGQRAVVSQVGILARTVADVALGTGVIAGPRGSGIEPAVPLGDYRAIDVSRLRVAVFEDDGSFPSGPAVRRGVREAAHMLEAAGARVTPWTPPDIDEALDLYFGLLTADGGRGLGALTRGEKIDSTIAPLMMFAQKSRRTLGVIRALLNAVGQRGSSDKLRAFGHGDTHHYWQLVERQMAYRERFLRALDDHDGGPFDVVLCPPCAVPAYTHGAARDLGLLGSYHLLANLLGFPAGVVPVTRVRADEEAGRAASRDMVYAAVNKVERNSAGLPIGAQLIARPWREDVALAAMQTIETAAKASADYPHTPVEVAR
ncbi:MAG: fatty acid amide hydrolase [Candidatus Eremiobacteraeota bacterium]|jgi:fatty acid amide hydrolase|nr:fatty acid amide hydrolase [Candidatus Eremiobacteraeota bacterium]